MIPLFIYNDLPKLLSSVPGPTDPRHLQHLTDHVVDSAMAVEASILAPTATIGALGVMWLLLSNGIVHFSQAVLAFSEQAIGCCSCNEPCSRCVILLRRSRSRLASHLLNRFSLQARVRNLRCDCLVRAARFPAPTERELMCEPPLRTSSPLTGA